MSIKVKMFPLGPLQANCVFVYDDKSKECIIVDPGDKGPQVVQFIQQNNLKLKYILASHAHFDHIFGAGFFKKQFPDVPVQCHKLDAQTWSAQAKMAQMFSIPIPSDNLENPDSLFNGESTFSIGEAVFTIIPTPGHTPGSVCIYCAAQKIIISGDTIFSMGVGRTDFPGGSAQQLQQSLEKLKKECDGSAAMYSGHGPAGNLGDALRNAQMYV